MTKIPPVMEGLSGHVVKIAGLLVALGTIWTYSDNLGLRPLVEKDLAIIHETIDTKVKNIIEKVTEIETKYTKTLGPQDKKNEILRLTIEDLHTTVIKEKEKFNVITEEDKKLFCQSAYIMSYRYLPGYCYPYIDLNNDGDRLFSYPRLNGR
jgi:hypothetical protein